jgi:hypothetical protein
MTERMDDRDLERTLSDIGARLDVPRRDLWPAVRSRIAERRATPWWSRLPFGWRSFAPVAATLAVILAVAFLFTPPVADALGHLLSLPGIQIYRVPQTPSARPNASAPTFPGQRVASAAEASRIAGFTVRMPAGLGDPSAIYVETAPVRVTIVYASVPGIPVSPQAGVSAIVVEFKGTIETQIMAKAVGPGTTLDAVPLGSGVAYYLAGQPHQFFFRDPTGLVQPETLRLAGNTLLWQEDGTTYRLEAQVGRDEAVRIASTLR